MLELSPRDLRLLARGARALGNYAADAEERTTAKALAVALTAAADKGHAVMEGIGPLPGWVDGGTTQAQRPMRRWHDLLSYFREGGE